MDYTLKKKRKYWYYFFRVNQKQFKGITRTETKGVANDYVKNLFKQLYYHTYLILTPRRRTHKEKKLWSASSVTMHILSSDTVTALQKNISTLH